VRGGYYTAQAAEQRLEMRRTIFDATDASYTLAQRLHDAGNITDLDLLRERDLHEQARIDLADAESMRLQSRERLSAVLGLWGEETAWTLSGRLDPPADDELELEHFERVAVGRSLDLEAERWRLRAAGGRVGLARLDRWLPDLGVGVAAERDGADGEWTIGPAVVVAVPLWDRNTGAIERRESELSQARHRYTALAVEVRAEARATRERLRAARARALAYRDTVLPLRAELVAETHKARNAMAASSFELLAAKRRQIEAGAEYVDALRDYWLARTAAEQVLAGRRPGVAPATPPADGSTDDSATGEH
jgi:cobalt-zinc-cadmium efflux system outer membrane protein